jgi:Ca-activated chloride channel family protein
MVTIDGQVARTRVDQVFKSNYGQNMEATYLFPIPEGAAIKEFSLWVGGEKVSANLLDASEARRMYQAIVRHRQDPALLEYVGRGLFQARVFPVPAHGESRIEIEYTELLSQRFSTVRYSYPLNTERFSSRPIDSVLISVGIQSSSPILNVYSPSHDISVSRPDDHAAEVHYEESHTRPDTDLALYYTISEDDIGLGLLTYSPTGRDGYFLLLASPRPEVQDEEIAAKDVVFVFDRTGSMNGKKIAQARDALIFCLRNLNADDRFNVIPFNERPAPLFNGLVPASTGNIDQALASVAALSARGGTNIDEALVSALHMLKSEERPSYVIFLTDGLPTVGTSDIEQILADARRAAARQARIFSFGVGYDVNTTLLDKLALQHKGSTEYVRPQEDIEVKVSNLFSMVSYPILADLRLDFQGMQPYEVFPGELPDLFKGSQITVVGRFRGEGEARITLSGRTGDSTHKFQLVQSLDSHGDLEEFVPLIWAQRKIGFLLEEIRLHGRKQELVDEIVKLSKEYGIITEYTSFLVERPEIIATRDFEVLGREEFQARAGRAMVAETGSWGVNQSVNIQSSKKAAMAPTSAQTYLDANGDKVTISGVRNVQNRAFFQQDRKWIENHYIDGQVILTIKAWSEAQFQLLQRDPSLGKIMALGEEVLFLVNGQAVQIGPSGQKELTTAELDQLFGS